MTRLAGNPDLRKRMGAAGTRKIQEYFDWEKKVGVMLDIYADAVKDAAPVSRDRPDGS